MELSVTINLKYISWEAQEFQECIQLLLEEVQQAWRDKGQGQEGMEHAVLWSTGWAAGGCACSLSLLSPVLQT